MFYHKDHKKLNAKFAKVYCKVRKKLNAKLEKVNRKDRKGLQLRFAKNYRKDCKRPKDKKFLCVLCGYFACFAVKTEFYNMPNLKKQW